MSWEEFEQGFGVVTKMGDSSPLGRAVSNGLSLPGSVDDEEEDEEDMFGEPTVTGTVQVEMEDGRTIEVDAQEYINNLKVSAFFCCISPLMKSANHSGVMSLIRIPFHLREATSVGAQEGSSAREGNRSKIFGTFGRK